MGLTFSSLLLGFHTLLEVVAGSAIFITANPISTKKGQTIDRSGSHVETLACVWSASHGICGVSGIDRHGHAIWRGRHVSATLSWRAAAAMFVGIQDKAVTVKEAVVTNVHLYVALGLLAIKCGLVD